MAIFIEWNNIIAEKYHRVYISGLYYDNVKYDKIIEWCNDNINGVIMKTGQITYFLFEDELEATAFKLRWT